MRLDDLRIGTRMAGGFGGLIAVFLAVMALLGVRLGEVEQGAPQIKDETLPFILAVEGMVLNVSQVQQFLMDVAATHNRDGGGGPLGEPGQDAGAGRGPVRGLGGRGG